MTSESEHTAPEEATVPAPIARQLRDALTLVIPDLLVADLPLATITAVREAIRAYDVWERQEKEYTRRT